MPRFYHPDIEDPELDRLAERADHQRQELKDRQLEEAWEEAERKRATRTFRAGDTVHHAPSGEDWVLATDQENGRVSPSGWPATMADATDCRLLEPATDEQRLATLQEWAATGKGHEHEQDHRTRAARRQLEAEKSTQKAPPTPDQG